MLVPSPQGDFLTVKVKCLFGKGFGPLTTNCFSFASFTMVLATYSRFFVYWDLSIILIVGISSGLYSPFSFPLSVPYSILKYISYLKKYISLILFFINYIVFKYNMNDNQIN